MLFRITEHYDIYNNDYSILDDEIYCLICHDKAYLQKHIKLNSNKYYFKKCKCDGYIHKNCLDKWLTLNMSCPYCRKEIELNNSLFKKIIILYYNCAYKIYVYYLINIIKIQGFAFFIFWVYFIYNFYYMFIFFDSNNIYENPYETNNKLDKYTSNMNYYNFTN